jgi:acetyl-CoA carboxylase, biotin carboxylase subunit
MIRSLLIANRGEIAVRIIRTCREMGIRAIAVYSTADADALHVKMADDAVCIGPPSSTESYLNIRNIITAACVKRCDAIHPGVGFLSENAEFARAVQDAGLIFIGPDAKTISLLGNKVVARTTALEADLPITPGGMGRLESADQALKIAEEIGYPVILKAASGGGGRGMRIVRFPKDLPNAFAIAGREAKAFFSDDTLHMEKYLSSPRHVEMQMLADGKGNVVHLGERDCSVQKNHQKLIEESPSTAVPQTLRDRMGEDSVRLFTKLGYKGAGTIEFLVHEGQYFFMEVNARVQVEHPVSELVSMTDIIRQQILIASGKGLCFTQKDIRLQGHALECRLNASTPGRVSLFNPPLGPWVRIDTHMHTGSYVSPHYDPLVAKIIVHTPDRQTSIDAMIRALKECRIEGIETNMLEQITILNSSQFRSGRFGTDLYGKLGLDTKKGK